MSNKPSRPRTPINPVVLIILGLGIAIYAVIIMFSVPETPKDIMYIFAIIGVLFFVVGLVRQLKNVKSDPSQTLSNEERNMANTLTRVSPNNPVNQKTVITCPMCSSRNYSTSNFCHMCGGRLH